MLERENINQPEGVEAPKPTPYVVSEDIKLLLQDWSYQNGFNLLEHQKLSYWKE